ncbi:MAG: hypothetical protein ACC742_07520 [Thermoanaerobaculales bacterium]
MYHDHRRMREIDMAYLEVAYKLSRHWQAAVRYDWVDGKLLGDGVGAATSLQRHKDIGLALNYWFNQNLVLKLEYHSIDGNLAARPDDLQAVLSEGGLDETTELLQLGVQFTF